MTTCRFAQRVALIKNEAVLNEELDPKLVKLPTKMESLFLLRTCSLCSFSCCFLAVQMVAHLQQQVLELKQELAMTTGEQRTDELTPEDKNRYSLLCLPGLHYALACTCACFVKIRHQLSHSSVQTLVEAFVGDASPEAKLVLGPDIRKILLAFDIMKVPVYIRSNHVMVNLVMLHGYLLLMGKCALQSTVH